MLDHGGVSSGCGREVEDSFTSLTMEEEEAQPERQVRSTERKCRLRVKNQRGGAKEERYNRGGGGEQERGADGLLGDRKLKLAYLRAAEIKGVEVREEIK